MKVKSEKVKRMFHKGKFRWAIERKDGKPHNKYNADGTKNVYHHGGKTLDRKDIKTWGLTDDAGKAVAVMDVPEGAVVFQRRRQFTQAINYRSKFYDVEDKLPPVRDRNKILSERVVKRRLAEAYRAPTGELYDQVWLSGWRKREADGSVTVSFKAVYPDGKVENYSAFGEKPWLYEPEWFTEEKV